MDIESFLYHYLDWTITAVFIVIAFRMAVNRMTFRQYLIAATLVYALATYLSYVRGTWADTIMYAVMGAGAGAWAYARRPPRRPVPDGSHERL